MISLQNQSRIHSALAKAQNKLVAIPIKAPLPQTVEARRPIKPLAKIPKDVAQSALKGFMPFGDTPAKQQRYKDYLRFMSEEITELPPPPKTLSNEDVAHEPIEFSKAAMIFRPLSKMMADRFSSATVVEVFLLTQKTDSKMFQHSRSTGTWVPDRITCKRFGVAFVKKDEEEEDEDKIYEKLAVNTETMTKLLEERDRILADEQELPVDTQEEAEREEEPEVELEPLQRPPMDLFKAIFNDDSDEDEKDDMEEKEKEDLNKPFRPVFSKPSKPKQNSSDKKRASAVKLDSLEEFDGPPIFVPRKKVRPSAADYM
jgi:G patch domain-containing protein 1